MIWKRKGGEEGGGKEGKVDWERQGGAQEEGEDGETGEAGRGAGGGGGGGRG